MSTISCPQCKFDSPFGTSFCGNCGFNLVAVTGSATCNTCGAGLKPNAKFCGSCGATVKATMGMTGSVQNGEWHRGDGEFVKRVDPDDMKSSWGGKSVKVPAGTICAVVKDGKVETIHQSGHKVAVGAIEGFFGWLSGGIDASFYLIDCSPIPFATNEVRSIGNREQHINVRIQAFLVQSANQTAQLDKFLGSVVKGKSEVTTQDVYTLMRKQVVSTVKSVLRKTGDDFFQAEKRIVQSLKEDLGNLYGLHFVANVESGASMYTVNVQLGQNEVPKMADCVNGKCGKQLPFSKRFCGFCGERQPIHPEKNEEGVEMPLTTSDGHQLELDVVFQLQGQGDFGQNESLIPAIASAAAGAVRGMTASEAMAANGLRKIQDEIADKLTRQITGFQLKKVVVLDVKDKNGQWLLNARADVQRQKDQLELNKEWMSLEADEMSVEKMALEMVLERQNLQRDMDFERLKMEQADELRKLENTQQFESQTTDLTNTHNQRMQDSTLNHALAMDERDLKDTQNRVAMEDARADIDIHNTNRDVNTAIGKDEAGRRLNRHVDEQDHIDNRTQYGRDRETLEQERDDQFADDKINMQHGQDMENMQIEHEMANERRVVDQNIWIKDQQVDSTIRTNEKMSDSDNRIHLNQAKTEDEIDWMKAQTADKTKRMDIETDLFADKAHSDLAFEDDSRRNTMDQGNLDAEQARLSAQAEIAAKLSAAKREQMNAHELAMDAQHSQHEQTMKGMDVDVEKTRINAEHDKDVAVSQAQLEAEREKAQRERELAEERSAMERQFREESAAKSDKQSDMMMAMMQNLTQGLSGMNQVQQEQQKATIDAHKDAAAQARDMANSSMSSMSNVAAAAAGNRPAGQPQPQQGQGQGTPQGQQTQSDQPSANQGPMGFHTTPQPGREAATKASAKPSCAKCGSANVGPKFCFDCGTAQ